MAAEKQPIKVFYFYSYSDRKQREMLGNHLSLLKGQLLIPSPLPA